jgi:hypothetical protein
MVDSYDPYDERAILILSLVEFAMGAKAAKITGDILSVEKSINEVITFFATKLEREAEKHVMTLEFTARQAVMASAMTSGLSAIQASKMSDNFINEIKKYAPKVFDSDA